VYNFFTNKSTIENKTNPMTRGNQRDIDRERAKKRNQDKQKAD